MYALVMAGGAGTRLWPLSRRKTPKQLLPLTGDASLLQQTVARLEPLLQPHDIFVITAESHVHATQRQLPQIPEGNILGEPLARSTAVAAALGALLARRQTDEVAIVLPADHHVADAEKFVAALREAVVTAERGYLVVLGVVPSHPATGYGYSTRGEQLFVQTVIAAQDQRQGRLGGIKPLPVEHEPQSSLRRGGDELLRPLHGSLRTVELVQRSRSCASNPQQANAKPAVEPGG